MSDRYFDLSIRLETAAFNDPEGGRSAIERNIELARILRGVANTLLNGRDPESDPITLRDTNGNTCGKAEIVASRRAQP